MTSRYRYTSGVQLLILLAMFCTSCKKFLDKNPNDQATVPVKLEDLQALLDNAIVMNNATVSWGEASADDYFWMPDTYDAMGLPDQQAYTWVRQDYTVYPNDWSAGYQPVYNANFCMEGLEKIDKHPLNEKNWNNVMGSALFFRAYHFLQLAGNHAKAYDVASYEKDPGIALRTHSDFNIPSMRANVKSTYEQIIRDARSSADYLPDNPSHPLRPSKAASYGLLARCYLTMRIYDSAFKYSDLCLKIKNTLMNFNGDPDIVNLSGNVPFVAYNKETIFYTQMNSFKKIYSPSFSLIDSTLCSYFQPGDLRKTAYFSSVGPYYKFKGNYTGNSNIFFSGLAVDEILLIRAESLARIGKTDEAMNDLNNLLVSRWDKNRTYIPITAANGQEAVNIILKERRKELLMRGLRWPDIKRLNKENRNIILKRVIRGNSYFLPPNDERYALLLPIDIILQSGMEQN